MKLISTMPLSKNQYINQVVTVWQNQSLTDIQETTIQKPTIVEEIGQYFAPGNYFYFIFNLCDLKIESIGGDPFSVVGINKEALQINTLMEAVHVDDLKTMQAKEEAAFEFFNNRIPIEQVPHYKASSTFRLKTPTGGYRTFLRQGQVLALNTYGKIRKTINVITDITHLHPSIDQSISFISSKFPSFYSLDPYTLTPKDKNPIKFTQQETTIITLMAQGLSAKEIGIQLNSSVHTIRTHQKNMLHKTGFSNSVQLIADCIKKGII
ncbi:helix-turn-helix transcriptional regulator [Algivirga pacifica]|uniref:HTH luxR-type domain-containing protein n=1 Tax=Algivirga pacifica TaxID=1162670 RepID=A0ABP9D9F2_9BACT